MSKVHFKCTVLWYVQKGGLAWAPLCSNTSQLTKEVPKSTVLNVDNKEVCHGCQKKVTYRTKGVQCEACLNPKTQTSLKQYGIAGLAKKQQEADRTENGVKVFL